MVFVDVIPNPHKDTLTLATAFDGHLLTVCPFSHYTDWRGLEDLTSASIIKAIEAFHAHTANKGANITLQYLRADAASYFNSQEFIEWGNKNNIKISIAAPHHQEMNSIVERQWQTMSEIIRAILVHARLSNHFYHFAAKYAKDIINVLPSKNLLDHNGNPTTPHFLAFRRKPKIGNYRVFGCPASFKRYTAQTHRTQTQQATRGIFIGFPSNQAGWLFYTEKPIGTHHIHVSHDATFDEFFDSALVFDTHPFKGSLATRPPPTSTQLQSFDPHDEHENTGSVTDTSNPTLPLEQSEEGTEEEEQVSITDPQNDSTELQLTNQQDIEDSQNQRYPTRIRRKNTKYFPDEPTEEEEQAMFTNETICFDTKEERMHSSLYAFKHHIVPEFQEALAAIQAQSNEPIDLYLPEPQGIKSMLHLPPKLKNAWLKAYKSELKNLIIDNETFAIETPKPGEKVIPTKPVFKAKQTQDGMLDKLKVREVARGDLERHDDDEDTWSPGTSFNGVRMHLAQAAKAGRTPKQADFIGAYLQARVRGRHFVRLSGELAKYFPEYSKWFGVPLRLKKGMYGLVFAGKWWNEEFTDWLFSDGFEQSKADPTFYAKYHRDGRYIKLVYHTDDMVYYGTDDEIERQFEDTLKGRFHITFNGPAQWFLQMRIHNYSCGSISIDQQRYTLNIINRYNPPEAPWGVPPYRETPAPTSYIFTKKNRPTTEEKSIIETKFKGLHFRSAVCSILYLAFGTRADIMFITCKLSKACHDPGIKDFEALLWLFGYLRKHTDLGIKFYHDATQSPIYQLAKSQNVPNSELTVFSDASWQDCPDTGRSTAGELVYCQGGYVHARSHVPVPVAMSSAESEYMSACSACMAASHLRMLLYDHKYLGTTRYSKIKQMLDMAPSVLMVDNQAAVQMGMNDKLTKLTRHIARRFHYVREGIKQGHHNLYWISKEHQLADILTKTQSATIIDPLLNRAMFRLPTFLTKPSYAQIVGGKGNSRGVSEPE
jgi:hypothetical protein